MKRSDKYLELARELKKNDVIDCNWRAWNSPQMLNKKAGRVGNWRTNPDYSNCSSFEIGENTEKSLRDQRRIAVTQTQQKNQLLTLRGKSHKE